MSVEKPQVDIEQATKLQTIEDIEFEFVTESDPDFETALSIVNTNGKESPEELREKAKKEIVRTGWWLQEQWLAKGIPKEQFTIEAGNLNIELYNYGQDMSFSQIEEARRIIAVLSQSSIPEQNSKIKYITISDRDELNDQDGEDKRGYTFSATRMFSLYPRALSSEPHRIPDTSSLAGTLAHEFGHIYISADGDFRKEWARTFGWQDLPDDQVDRQKPAPKKYVTKEPERCVTDYAQFSPDEDICESLSAVVNNPTVLDTEKLAFIRERWLKEEEVKIEASAERKIEADIKMPRVPDKVKYKAKVMTFTFGTAE